MWRINNILLNDQWLIEEIKEEKKYLQTNDNKNTMTPNLQDAAKAVLLKIIYLFGCIRSQLWDVGSSLHHVRASVEVHGLCVVAQRLSIYSTWAQLLHSVWDLSSPTRGLNPIPCNARHILNHWNTRGVSKVVLRGKFIAIKTYFGKQENLQITQSYT